MNRTVVLGLILGAIALPAAAASSVKVDLSNLDAKTAHARIAEAADKVCRAEFHSETSVEEHYDLIACIEDTTEAAEAKFASHKSTLAKL